MIALIMSLRFVIAAGVVALTVGPSVFAFGTDLGAF